MSRSAGPSAGPYPGVYAAFKDGWSPLHENQLIAYNKMVTTPQMYSMGSGDPTYATYTYSDSLQLDA